ncbi:VOC family protein [Aeromonas veronii]
MTNPTVAVDEVYWNPMVPELSVTDLARALVFYTGLLGFSVRYRRDDPPFAYLEQQQVQLMLEQVHPAGWQVGALEPPFGRGINLQMELTEIQPLLDRLQAAGIALFRQPTEVWYPVGEMLAG